jgi:hypothetical protein
MKFRLIRGKKLEFEGRGLVLAQKAAVPSRFNDFYLTGKLSFWAAINHDVLS